MIIDKDIRVSLFDVGWRRGVGGRFSLLSGDTPFYQRYCPDDRRVTPILFEQSGAQSDLRMRNKHLFRILLVQCCTIIESCRPLSFGDGDGLPVPSEPHAPKTVHPVRELSGCLWGLMERQWVSTGGNDFLMLGSRWWHGKVFLAQGK